MLVRAVASLGLTSVLPVGVWPGVGAMFLAGGVRPEGHAMFWRN